MSLATFYDTSTPPHSPLFVSSFSLPVGGAGICSGPSNFMGNPYMAIPIAITVEGANTLTRSLIIFGQGLTRSHPHLLDIIRSIQHGDDQKVRERQDKTTQTAKQTIKLTEQWGRVSGCARVFVVILV